MGFACKHSTTCSSTHPSHLPLADTHNIKGRRILISFGQVPMGYQSQWDMSHDGIPAIIGYQPQWDMGHNRVRATMGYQLQWGTSHNGVPATMGYQPQWGTGRQTVPSRPPPFSPDKEYRLDRINILAPSFSFFHQPLSLVHT